MSLTVDEKMENLDRFLTDYREKFHLDKIKIKDVDIATTVGEIKRLHPEEIAEKVLNWGLYSFAIQIRINEVKAKLTWVEDNLNRYWGIHQQNISKEYGFTAYDRKMLLLENNEYADKLYRLRTNLNIELIQLEYLPNNVNFLTKVATQIMEGKYRELNSNKRN
jgi:hypothetical protein